MANTGRWRKTPFIRYKPASNLHHATRFAATLGQPLNQFVTINFTKCSHEGSDASFTFRALVSRRFAPWLRRHPRNRACKSPTHVWVVEHAGGQVAVHWAVHVPGGLIQEFRRRLPRWVSSLVGRRPDDSAIHCRPIDNITGLKRYMLKGIDPAWAAFFKVHAVDQGEIVGRRSGFSKNLGPAARRRAGYRPQRRFGNAVPATLALGTAAV